MVNPCGQLSADHQDHELVPLTVNEIRRLLAALALTPARVAEAFRKHVDPEKLVIIRAGDLKK